MDSEVAGILAGILNTTPIVSLATELFNVRKELQVM